MNPIRPILSILPILALIAIHVPTHGAIYGTMPAANILGREITPSPIAVISEATDNPPYKESDTPQNASFPRPLIDNATDKKDIFTGDWIPSVMGVIDWNKGWRIYYYNRSKERTEYIYTEDFIAPSKPTVVDMPRSMRPIQTRKNVMCYSTERDTAYLAKMFDPENGCLGERQEIYQWNIDGTLPPSYVDSGFKQLGRIRGTSPKDEGGWDDDFPPYPDVENFPEVAEAFEPYPYYDASDWLRDRRGLSYHEGQYGEKWKSRILADPAGYNLQGFRGWTQNNKKGIADFYSAVVLSNNRALVKVFWKEKDRLIDRTAYAREDIDIRRRFRFTGETTIIPAIIQDGRLKIESTGSVIPLRYHERRAHPEIHWATKPDRMEVGQMTPTNRVIEKDGYVYIIYGYRDDVHYENLHHDHDRIRHHSGIFVHRMRTEEFDRLFPD